MRLYGQSHPRAKLIDHDVEMIRQLHEQGMGYRQTADKFGVSRHTVKSICLFRRRGRVSMCEGKA